MPAICYKLLRYTPSDIGAGGVATYGFEHATDGRQGTCLRFEVDLRIVAEVLDKDQRVEATIRFDGCTADSPVHALDRLSGWLDRAAEAVLMMTSPSSYDADTFEPPKIVTDAGVLPVGGRLRLELAKPPGCGWPSRDDAPPCVNGGRHTCVVPAGPDHGDHRCACGATWSRFP